MTRNAYTVLKVSEDASEAAIERAYQLRVMEIETNMSMPGDAKHAELAALEEANRILSRTTTRDVYDRKLAAERGAADASGGGLGLGLITTAVVIAIAGGGYVWMQQRDAARQLAEQERIAVEQKAAAANVARIKFEEQQQRDATERLAAEEARLAEARELREREMKAEKFVGMPPMVSTKTPQQLHLESVQRQAGEMAAKYEVEGRQLQAQQIADRQRRYVDQIARENNSTTDSRAAAERENARRRMEDRRLEELAAAAERLRALELEAQRRR